MGSRQEYHWESDEVLSACAGSVMSDFLTPRDCCPPSSAVHGIFQVRIPEWLAIFLLQGMFPNQGSNPFLVSPLLAGGFFTTAPPGNPKVLKLLLSPSVMSNSLRPHGLQHTRLPCPSPPPGAC